MYLFQNTFLVLAFGLIATSAAAQDAPAPPGQQGADLVRACHGEPA